MYAMEQKNIVWSDISSGNSVLQEVEPCKMESYVSLYVELKEKCNPKKYMYSYDKDKVDIANELYNELLDADEKDEVCMRRIRDKAIRKLNVNISTKKLYKRLLDYCDPQKYMEPYDFEVVKIVNSYYSLVKERRNNVYELEKLNDEILQDRLLKEYYAKVDEIQRKDSKNFLIRLILYLFFPVLYLFLFFLNSCLDIF